jgi:dipeptidyl aminopeptidase/acylaminoacyl peptidase
MKWVICLVMLVQLFEPCHGEDSDWTIEEILGAETVTDLQISADGKFAVWVKTKMDEDKGKAISSLVRTNLETAVDTILTRGSDSCHTPRISPDGKHIAFLTDRPSPNPKPGAKRSRNRARNDAEKEEPKTQIWLFDTTGGEPWPLTDFSRDIDAFQWLGSDAILFLAKEQESHYEAETKEKKDTSDVVEDEVHEPAARLFKTDLSGKKLERVTMNTDRIDWFVASPDGKRVVTHHQKSLRYTYDAKIKPVVELLNLENGKSEVVFADKYDLESVRWTPDSNRFYAIDRGGAAQAGEGAYLLEVLTFDVKEKAIKKVPLDWERGLTVQDLNSSAPSLVAVPGGFLALLADGVRPKLARFTEIDGKWKRELLTGEHAGNTFALQTSADGKSIAYAFSRANLPTQWYHARVDASKIVDSKKIAKVNEGFEGKRLDRSDVIRWKGASDEEIEGILYYPKGFEKGKRYPLVVMIHGGPFYSDGDRWDEDWAYSPHLFTQRGALVLRPNYHGSSAYGLKFGQSIANGKYYQLEVPDIEKGVDHLIQEGLADADKLGVMGWSNGSILTIALTVHTTRYKVAVAGAGDVDWVSDWGNCEFGDSFDRYYFGKSPLEDPKKYQEISPFYKLDKVRTPTLIFFGTEDRAVPTQQGWMHYRALQQLGKADVRFVLFPGEQHGPKQYVHQKRKLKEELDWFDKYLFKTSTDKLESLKENSPLARLLDEEKLRRRKQAYGQQVKDKLVPELARYEGIEVGRFEVTRAQFAEFDGNHAVEPGKDNYPANGISFDRAKAYCDWLSKLTGDTYRLPNEEEAEKLYADPSEEENTLDHWAGYSLNPDDAKKLVEKLKNLPGKAALLKEVGTFRSTKEKVEPADLGGNVAEWTTNKEGKAKLMGGSADRPADAKQRGGTAAEEYRGFRVVKEGKEKK